ncbi:MAG: ATP-binding cassette domain-containing protein, partial [Tritonibacter mobilis]|nr:ATP-binding cassette domain-containing protein [Tritonibacter mobilis]
MITVENLSMDFTGKAGSAKALSDVSFAISAGEILGIVGKSGAGKTTLLRLLSFQMRPNSGRILIDGEPVDHTTSARALRSIVQQSATVFQGFSLLYNRNVVENVALPLKLRGMSRRLREEKARDLLNFVGLAHRARAYPITLSGGEAQRVAIARALVTDPKILFLDE